MPTALALALAQLTDRRVLAVLAKSAGVTLAVMVLLGAALWWGLERAFASVAMLHGTGPAIAAIVTILAEWLLFRLVAIAVVQFFADEVVVAVEAKHYPEAAARARPLGLRREIGVACLGLLRSLGWNLAALPVAALLLVTGLGTVLLFGLVNALLLGRELTDMVRLRHEGEPPVGPLSRLALGSVVAMLLAVPFVNFLAPVIGAAAATHLVHRRVTGVSNAS